MLKKKYLLLTIICLLVLVSCNNYGKLLKSTDNEAKYKAAMSFFEKRDYNRALQLYDMLQSVYNGKPQGEEIAYHTAECYFNMSDYNIAAHYYKRYVINYPSSQRTEYVLFKSAYCYYLESPSISLDQADTYTAINELQQFIDIYPKSVYVDSANKIIDTLRYKLEEKDFNTCMLYYKMDEYLAAITSFENLLKNYPGTRYRENILKYMILTYYNYAEKSVAEKQRERYELAIEKYNTLTHMYPDSKYIKELEPVITKIREKKLLNIK